MAGKIFFRNATFPYTINVAIQASTSEKINTPAAVTNNHDIEISDKLADGGAAFNTNSFTILFPYSGSATSASMFGETAIYKLYPAVEKSDVPFAQDCVADQYILRGRTVYKLYAETGELECLDFGLGSFLSAVSSDPVEFLGLEPLLQIQEQGQSIEPGQVIHVYPPFCTEEAKNGVSLKLVSNTEALTFLSDFSKQINKAGNSEKVEVRVTE